VDIRHVIRKAIRRDGVAADVNAVVAANVGKPGRTKTKVSSHQRIVQRSGRTEVSTKEREAKTGE
jgi:hypothetical protein